MKTACFIMQDGSVDSSQQCPLRLELVHSLCIADQLGVLKSIEHIARTLHAENQPQPPPPPYISYPKPRQCLNCYQSTELASNSDIAERTSIEDISTISHPLLQCKSTGLELEIATDDCMERDGLRRGILWPETVKPKSALEQKSDGKTQAAAIDSGLKTFGIGAGTFMY